MHAGPVERDVQQRRQIQNFQSSVKTNNVSMFHVSTPRIASAQAPDNSMTIGRQKPAVVGTVDMTISANASHARSVQTTHNDTHGTDMLDDHLVDERRSATLRGKPSD